MMEAINMVVSLRGMWRHPTVLIPLVAHGFGRFIAMQYRAAGIHFRLKTL